MTENPLPAALFYDERLHVDSYVKSQYVPDHMLSLRLRKPGNFSLLYLEDGSASLYYKNIIAAAEERSTPTQLGDLFMFPPESVYHMQPHLQLMKTAYRRLCNMEVPEADKTLQIAFQLFGNTVTAEMVRYIPLTVTHSVAAHQREIPCMTFQQGFQFTLVVEHNSVRIIPTEPTSVHDSDTLGLGARIPSALPLRNDGVFSIDRLAAVMTNGLRLCADDGMREIYLHPAPPDLVGVEMPFAFFPVVLWKQALSLRGADQVLRLPHMPPPETRLGGVEPFVRVVRAEAFFAFLETSLLLSIEETAAYLAENKDVPKIKDKLCTCRMSRLVGRDKPDILTFFLVQSAEHAPDDASARRYLYFNTRSHLKWHLQQSKGQPFEQTHNTLWHGATQHLLVPGRNVFSPYDDDEDTGGFMLMHRIESHDKGRTLVIEAADYDDRFVQAELEAVAECRTRVQALKKWLRDAEQGLHEPCDADVTARRALLATREAEYAQRALLSAGVKMTRTVRFLLSLCASTDFTLEWTLGPPDNWHHDGACGLGIIQKHPPRVGAARAAACGDSEYLRNGQYYVECLLPGQQHACHALMDFVTVSRCLLREGRGVFLRLNRARYFELCACVQKAVRRGFVMRAPADIHRGLTASAESVQLEAFYVLGDGEHKDAEQHVVRLAVIVHSLNLMDGSYYYNEQDKHKVIVNVRLVDADNNPIVTVHQDPECETFHNLVYTSKTEAARETPPLPLAPLAQRDVWLT